MRDHRLAIGLKLPPTLVRELDDWCASQPVRPTRTAAIEEAIRRLVSIEVLEGTDVLRALEELCSLTGETRAETIRNAVFDALMSAREEAGKAP